MRANEIKNETYQIKKQKEKNKIKDLKYETTKHICDFQQHETIRSFVERIYNCKAKIVESLED